MKSFEEIHAESLRKMTVLPDQPLGIGAYATWRQEKVADLMTRQAAALQTSAAAMLSAGSTTFTLRQGFSQLKAMNEALEDQEDDRIAARKQQRLLGQNQPMLQVPKENAGICITYEEVFMYAQKYAMEWEQIEVSARTPERLNAFIGNILDMCIAENYKPSVGKMLIAEFHKLRS